MGHTYTSLHYHLIFGTLGRRNLIPQADLPRLHGYIGGVVKALDALPIAVGGIANHVHVLMALPASTTLAPAVNKIKSNSSHWARQEIPAMADFRWQEGYGAFTISRSQIELVATYIARQPERHRTVSFEDEFLQFLQRHGVDYDPAQIWA